MEANDDSFVVSCRRHSFLVEFLSILLGINSLIATNGLWVELPVLVPSLPEGWQLPAFLTVIIQIANIGPIIYSLAAYKWPKSVTETRAIFIMLAIGLMSSGCLVAFWPKTLRVAGHQYSISLMVLTFFLALVDSTSSIVCLPFMATFKPYYVTFYMIGEGLGGFLPSVVATAQGVEEYTQCQNVSSWNGTQQITILQPAPVNPRFSPEIFFGFLFITMAVSTIGFLMMVTVPSAKKERVDDSIDDRWTSEMPMEDFPDGQNVSLQWLKERIDEAENDAKSPLTLPIPTNSVIPDNRRTIRNDDGEDFVLVKEPLSRHGSTENCLTGSFPKVATNLDDSFGSRGSFRHLTMNRKRGPRMEEKEEPSRCAYYVLLGLQGWVSAFGYGVFPAVQSYSCLPYGSETYHIAVILVSTATPVACLLALFIPTKKTGLVFLFTIAGSVVSVYAMFTAVNSPNPVFVGTKTGQILVVGAWILFTGLFGYVKVAIASILRDYGHKALFWCGALTQAGSAVGALVMFLLVTVFKLFKEKEQC